MRCIVSLVAPWILAKIMGYHVGEAAGLLAGSQTISAVIGVASDTINQLGISDAQKATFINAIPVDVYKRQVRLECRKEEIIKSAILP